MRDLDVVGVGFGPANLALEIALRETEGDLLHRCFVERQPSFGWHRGMLLPSATMRVSFLKDLATMRDPRSAFTFVNYLQHQGRLADFINAQLSQPLRCDFHAYLEWASAQVAERVLYGREVVSVEPVWTGKRVERLRVLTRGAEGLRELVTRDLVVGAGLEPLLPAGVAASDRVFHSEHLLPSVERLVGDGPPGRVVVVGGGQSAAEATTYLHDRFQQCEVVSVVSTFGYRATDDSPFANQIFDPESVDVLYEAGPAERAELLRSHAVTNYGVVDLADSRALYLSRYQERVTGRQRLRFLNNSEVQEVQEHVDRVDVGLRNRLTGATDLVRADAVVLATGYRPVDTAQLLGGLLAYCLRDSGGLLQVDREHRVATTPDIASRIFVHGGATEATHGLSAGLLSTSAVRAGELSRSLLRTDFAAHVPDTVFEEVRNVRA